MHVVKVRRCQNTEPDRLEINYLLVHCRGNPRSSKEMIVHPCPVALNKILWLPLLWNLFLSTQKVLRPLSLQPKMHKDIPNTHNILLTLSGSKQTLGNRHRNCSGSGIKSTWYLPENLFSPQIQARNSKPQPLDYSRLQRKLMCVCIDLS